MSSDTNQPAAIGRLFRSIHGGEALFCILGAVWCIGQPVRAASPRGDVVGKITVGYQGWFACTPDGAPIHSWWHYSGTWQPPTPNTLTNKIHCWPDMRQFSKGYQTAFPNFANGQPATLFSSYDQQTVDTHFRWMAQNGIDTAALQRFDPFGGEGPSRNAISLKVMKAAQAFRVKFYIMYDCSGWPSNTFESEIESDWTDEIINTLHLTSSHAYARQNGKPVVGIWGFGFNDPNHPFDTNTCLAVINWFKNHGCYLMGGVPTHWLAGISDSRPGYLNVYSDFDMISPWMVGRIGNIRDSDNFYYNVNVSDQAYCNAHGIDYQPCVLPGDTHQRAHGDLMWHEFANFTRLGVQGLYISMFDEFNEGNQIACTAENAFMVPAGYASQYFTLDQDGTPCSSDYYLRLTRDGARMFKGLTPLTYTRPTVPKLPLVYPTPPVTVTADGDNGRVTLNWTAVAGEADVTSYNIERASSSGGPYTTIVTNVGLVSYTDSNVVNGVTYYYRVSAVNSLGESTNSMVASAAPYLSLATASSDNPPNETAAMAFDGLTSTKWFNANGGNTGWLQYYFGGAAKTVVGYALSSANDVPSRDPRNWQFQGSHNGANWTTLDTQSGQAFASRFQTIRYNLTNTTAYEYYRLNITANNGDPRGIQLSEMAFIYQTGAPPAAPTNLTVTAASEGQVGLSWAASAGATSYDVKQATASNGPYTTIANPTDLTYTNAGLANGTYYYFVVSAINSTGQSADSSPVGARPAFLTSPTMSCGADGSGIRIGWPQDHTGWMLQMQTDSLDGGGFGSNWVAVPGSELTNQMTLQVGRDNKSVFFRLVQP